MGSRRESTRLVENYGASEERPDTAVPHSAGWKGNSSATDRGRGHYWVGGRGAYIVLRPTDTRALGVVHSPVLGVGGVEPVSGGASRSERSGAQ